MKNRISVLVCGVLAGVFVSTAAAQFPFTLIEDDLNLDTSANYTIVNGGFNGGNDGTLEWAYDYSAEVDTIGRTVPVAPGTTDGSKTGVKMSVNNTQGFTEAFTIFHNTAITGVQNYQFSIDMYLSSWAIQDSGSTNHAQIGVSGDGVSRNHLFEFGNPPNGGLEPFSGSGHFVAITSEGGDSSDYRHWVDGAPVNQFDASYLSPDMDTNIGSANFLGHFENISNTISSIAAVDIAGSGTVGFQWATVLVEVNQDEGVIKYFVRGEQAAWTGPPGNTDDPEFVQIIEGPLSVAEGLVNFGLADLYASSALVPEDQWAIFDNLKVVGSNELGGMGPACDLDGDSDCDIADLDMLYDEINAGTSTNADIATWLADAGTENGKTYLPGDVNLDGSVSGPDFTALAVGFGNEGLDGVDGDAYWGNGNFDGNTGGSFSVGGPDFTNLAVNFGFTSVNAVPEPSSLAMISILGLCVLGLRGRK